MVNVYIFEKIKLFNFAKQQGVCLIDYKQELSMKSLIKLKMRINISIQFLPSFSSKIHINLKHIHWPQILVHGDIYLN
jgi:hypothetical protein